VGAAQGRAHNVDVRWELLYAEVLERAPAASTIEHAKALEHAPVPHAGGMTEVQMKEGRQTVVICGFGELGQTIANMLEARMNTSLLCLGPLLQALLQGSQAMVPRSTS
jgi:phosphoglycerate dehydrogenase-like enzyme